MLRGAIDDSFMLLYMVIGISIEMTVITEAGAWTDVSNLWIRENKTNGLSQFDLNVMRVAPRSQFSSA